MADYREGKKRPLAFSEKLTIYLNLLSRHNIAPTEAMERAHPNYELEQKISIQTTYPS